MYKQIIKVGNQFTEKAHDLFFKFVSLDEVEEVKLDASTKSITIISKARLTLQLIQDKMADLHVDSFALA